MRLDFCLFVASSFIFSVPESLCSPLANDKLAERIAIINVCVSADLELLRAVVHEPIPFCDFWQTT